MREPPPATILAVLYRSFLTVLTVMLLGRMGFVAVSLILATRP